MSGMRKTQYGRRQIRKYWLKKSTSKLDALINEDVGDAALFFLPGELSLTANATYHDLYTEHAG